MIGAFSQGKGVGKKSGEGEARSGKSGVPGNGVSGVPGNGAPGLSSGVAGTAVALRRTSVAGFTIHSEHMGEGPPVVLLHGLSGSRRWWRFTAPLLARHYRVHIPELVGFGGSRRALRQPDIHEMAALMAEWLAATGVTSPRVVGHSMGGQIALHMTTTVAMDRLALVCPSGLRRSWSVTEAARFLASALPPRAWGAPLFMPTIAVDAVRAGPRALMRAARHLLRDDVEPLLPRVSVRTLLIWGELDPLLPVEQGKRMASLIPGARLVVLRDAAHNPMADRPTDFNRILLEFLELP